MEEVLFDNVLGAAGRKGGGIGLIDHIFPQERHGPIELMQGEPFGPCNAIVSSPLVTESVGATGKKPMHHGKEDCSFHIEPEKPLSQNVSQDFLDAQLFPEPLEDQSRADLPGFSAHLAFPGEHQEDLLGKPGQRAHQGFDLPLFLQSVQPSHGTDNALHDLAADFAVFDDLEVAEGKPHAGESREPPSAQYVRIPASR